MAERRILYTEGLDAGYAGNAVVRNISIDLCPGQLVALIGPNGTGKSTILKTLSGMLPPVRGSVYLNGKDMKAVPENERARTISLLMTDRIDPELMTCQDVVSHGRYPYTGFTGRLSARDLEVIDSSLEAVGAADLKERYFSQISDGQRQRVLLARAITQEPKVLIMDEPTSFLDIRHKIELLRILLKLVKEGGVAAVISLHEIELARKTADIVICVKDGKAETVKHVQDAFEQEALCSLFDLDNEQYEWLYGNRSSGENNGFIANN